MRRVRYYIGRCEDALDSATTALHAAPLVDADWRAEFVQDLAVLRSKLDVIHTLMNGR
jgi:ubiquinone biosynthesis protein Coq4